MGSEQFSVGNYQFAVGCQFSQKIKWLVFLIILVGLSGCDSRNSGNEDVRFFVAGHTYGNPTNFQIGMYPPFMNVITSDKFKGNFDFGILTGDVVARNSADYWEETDKNLAAFDCPIFITPGNHDRGSEYETRYPEDSFQFEKGNCLFIGWNTEGWNVGAKDIEHLKNVTESAADQYRAIFIFMHELIWWSPENAFNGIEINYRPHYPGKTNFWQEVKPLLGKIESPVYLFAGDVGASEQVSPYSFHKEDHIRYISSGMGNGVQDNFLDIRIASGQIQMQQAFFHDTIRTTEIKTTDFKDLK